MGKSKKHSGTVYPTDALLKSEALSIYQQDFAAVLLAKPEYTLREAREVLDNIFKGGKH